MIVSNEWFTFFLFSEQFNEIDVAANAFFFFFVSFETTHSTLSLCLYELALNENVQQKLYSEIQQTRKTHSTLNYDSLNEMPYMDAVISGRFLDKFFKRDSWLKNFHVILPFFPCTYR